MDITKLGNWTQWLTNVDPASQQVASPFVDPYMVNPVVVYLPNGTSTGLNPRNWATLSCAQQVADTLGGEVTTVAPPWAPAPMVGGWQPGQAKYFVNLPNGTTTDPAIVANMFPNNKALLEAAFPTVFAT